MSVEKEVVKRCTYLLPADQAEWIANIQAKTGASGAVVIRAVLEKAMEDRTGRLEADIQSQENRIKLRRINEKMAELEEERQSVLKTSRREKVTA